MPEADTLDKFLVGHEPMSSGASLDIGTAVSNWRIVAFLGRGGSAEVYRAVHVANPHQGAAIKVLVRSDGSRLGRFRREADMLSELKCQALPRIYGSGEVDGKPYMAMELLEPYELPSGDREIASFLVEVAEGVKSLHDCGVVHRDIKPQNIMRRKDGSPVIIDLGLAKRISDSMAGASGTPASGHAGRVTLPNARQILKETLSVVDGRQVGLGTPQYAAPEQFSGGEITPAADIHALGKLADECFGGKSPRPWRRIVERATSSIPERRYQSVADFIRAIRRRNFLRTVCFCVSAALLLGAIVAGAAAWLALGGRESLIWRGLCERGEIMSVEKVYEPYESPVYGKCRRVFYVTNVVEGTVVNLQNRTFSFKYPIELAPGEYRIVGPGRLDAALSGPSNAVVRLKSCILNNMTAIRHPQNRIRYVMEGGAYLNFANLDESPQMRGSVSCGEECQGGNDYAVEFRGPLTFRELNQKRQDERDSTLREEIERANGDRLEDLPSVF